MNDEIQRTTRPVPPYRQLLLLAALTATIAACSPDGSHHTSVSDHQPPPTEAGSGEVSLAELIPYGGEPWPGILTGGQPSKEDFEALHEAGVRTVVNLRVPTEKGTRDQPAWMDELGFEYVSLPVKGAAGLSEAVATDLAAILETAERPVLVHCGSSNRVGAAFALRAFYLEGASADEALEIGKSAGLTRLEGRVREMLAD